ncbi:gamma-glutamyl-gamma-aminobutyrate hydrolase family protein [Streptomyces griseus]|uniref:gamma-glutamyl-gamma-aminobutyrate hydrolase family protein n=1 Tax=Streptomyces griseus TaxID=1911 RepID=UPI003F4D0568
MTCLGRTDGCTIEQTTADGTVESLELPGHGGLVLGVQWHPEMGQDTRVMAALVGAARERAALSPRTPVAGARPDLFSVKLPPAL